MAGVTTAKPGDLRVAVVQDGARLHYAVPLALQRAGALSVMYSEWFVKRGFIGDALAWALQRVGGGKWRGLWERRCDEIEPWRVRTEPWLALKERRGQRRFASDEAFYAWA